MANTPIQENNKSYIVGIGASAGGLEAIESFFKKMPADSGIIFVVVQHLSPDYKSLMAELLSKHTAMPVHRIEDGMEAKPNNIYLIPPRKNLSIFHGRLLLREQIRTEGLNLPIDLFLLSLAEDCNESAIGIILSGTGSDGTRGIRAIKERGGMVMVQDEETAKFNGMPNNAIATGLADFILAADEMPVQLLSFIKHPYSSTQQSDTIDEGETDLSRIFALLREKTKVDFTYYKPSTVLRRIERRVSINQLNDFSEYVSYLESNTPEITTLHQELLIGVTSFFRDDFVFENFNKQWLPELVTQLHNEELRVWVCACSTGEEAYSIAMLLAEYQERSEHYLRVKIFATDIDQVAIEKASVGLYPESIAADVPPDLLSKYFIRHDDNFQVSQRIREMVVFAQHNMIKDPPFTNINLLSCRNVLIYLQPILQKKILELFNFSLNKNGLLILGTSESIGEMVDYFDNVDSKSKVYLSKGKYKPVAMHTRHGTVVNDFQPSFTNSQKGSQDRYFDDRTLERFINGIKNDILPFTLIVDESSQVSHIFGEAKDYLTYPSGKINQDITKMV
ncbi:MAG: chemotaxis protein CheR, partial [Gammaproteobacteria bacterium]|nr:chemotaxis protein CheR [Gammaproteobacteria bacterium]